MREQLRIDCADGSNFRGQATAGNVALISQDSSADNVRGILIPMQPSLDQLIQITRTHTH